MIFRFLIPSLLIIIAQILPASPQRDTGIIGFTETVIRRTMKEHKVPGASFVLVDDQQIVAIRSFGFADLKTRTPVEDDTVFKLWSVSKAFTAIEIMRLVNEGAIGLDDPVTAHLPRFVIGNRFPAGRTITIRDILTHRSGLPRNDALAEPEETLICEVLEDKVSSLRHAYLSYPVGRRYKYSNIGFDLLGRIIELKRGTCFPWHMKPEHLGETFDIDDRVHIKTSVSRSSQKKTHGPSMPVGSYVLQNYS